MQLQRERYGNQKEPDPVRCCCECGREFHGGGHWHAYEAGWERYTRYMMNDKFKSRYVLGEGYPRLAGIDNDLVCMETHTKFFDKADIKFPKELFLTDIPKYRLVLERIDE